MLNCQLVTLLVSNFVCFSEFLFPLFFSPTDSSAEKARQQLEQKCVVCLKCIKFCGVRRTNRGTSIAVILVEIHLSSLKSFWWQQIIQFWNLLALAPNSSVYIRLSKRIMYATFGTKNLSFFHFALPQKHWHHHTSATTNHSCHQVIQGLDREASSPWNSFLLQPRSALHYKFHVVHLSQQ